MKCPVCKDFQTKILFVLYDDRYGYSGLYDLYKCERCGHKFIVVNFKDEELSVLYSQYYPRSNMEINNYKLLDYKGTFTDWLNGTRNNPYVYVPKGVRVLDIGCGFCETLGYYKRRGCEAYGVEADMNVRKIAEKFGFDVKIGLFNYNDYKPDFFDYVIMSQVIEHCIDPLETLKGVNKILKKDGLCILSTPNSNGWGANIFRKKWINWHIPYHVNIFSKNSLALLVQRAGFKIEFLKTITSSEWLYYQFLHIITYPALGNKSIFWNNQFEKASAGQKKIKKILALLHRLKINHLITRFFDFLGVGDNLVVGLRKR